MTRTTLVIILLSCANVIGGEMPTVVYSIPPTTQDQAIEFLT